MAKACCAARWRRSTEPRSPTRPSSLLGSATSTSLAAHDETCSDFWPAVHCSLQRDGERTVLIDHSRYGTWINGARVRERAPVRPGDRVRVGTPGVEFTLISAAAFGGAS